MTSTRPNHQETRASGDRRHSGNVLHLGDWENTGKGGGWHREGRGDRDIIIVVILLLHNESTSTLLSHTRIYCHCTRKGCSSLKGKKSYRETVIFNPIIPHRCTI